MPLTPIKDIRRQELLKAAFEIIQQHGLPAASISRIAQEAGASKGIVHHYFENKEQLIGQAVRYAHAKRSEDLVSRLAKANTPSERLWSIISMTVDPRYLKPGFCKAWNSLSAEAPTNRAFARLLRIIHTREKSNLVHALRQLNQQGDLNETALAIHTLLEGIRRRCLFPPPYSPQAARHDVVAFLKRSVPAFDLSAAGQQ